ncbi:tudor domain-containing protein 7A [Stigmatopora argus]
MSDELIKKNLRSVLQSSKEGVALTKLQFEYSSLCGEDIPLHKLGFKNMEDFLRSIPSVVRLDYKNGDLRCFAAVCSETAHIAQLVARQKSSKKSGCSQTVSCKMRPKASNPSHMHTYGRPSRGGFSRPGKDFQSHGGYKAYSASGDFRQAGQGCIPPIEHRQPVLQAAVKLSFERTKSVEMPEKSKENPPEKAPNSNFLEYDKIVVQEKLTLLLQKYCSGLWMSKLPIVFSDMFKEQLHPQVLKEMEKWTHICLVEKSSSSTNDRLVYPPLPSLTTSSCSPTKSPVNSSPTSKSHSAVVPEDLCHKIKDLLSKYSSGLWAHALPKLFMDTYKVPFPEHLMDKLSLLPDLCTVEYPVPTDSKKAILYASIAKRKETNQQKSRGYRLPSGLEVIGRVVPACLVHPSAQYSTVLIINAKSSNAVTVRYVGKDYSNAQEEMEDAMLSFYKENSNLKPLPTLVVGMLVAVMEDNGKEFTRGQVTKVTSNNIKVYYVDHGFTVETSRESLLELHPNFLSLPFQATNLKLAGLEAFSSHPSVLSTLTKLAVGRIRLMELLGPSPPHDLPEALLYDTSQDDDININSVCLKELQDQTMNNPLTVNSTYQGVRVTNVCADGIIFCQLPSRGNARLAKVLEETKSFFITHVTSDFLVSKPFHGKMCLTCYKDKWCRAEITHHHGNQVIEVLLIDLGVQATVEVTELREMPLLFIQDLTIIPSQAIRCCLTDVDVPGGEWSPDIFFRVKNAVLGVDYCKMKIVKLEEQKMGRLVHMYLFEAGHLHQSINQKLSNPEVWQKLNPAKSRTPYWNI